MNWVAKDGATAASSMQLHPLVIIAVILMTAFGFYQLGRRYGALGDAALDGVTVVMELLFQGMPEVYGRTMLQQYKDRLKRLMTRTNDAHHRLRMMADERHLMDVKDPRLMETDAAISAVKQEILKLESERGGTERSYKLCEAAYNLTTTLQYWSYETEVRGCAPPSHAKGK